MEKILKSRMLDFVERGNTEGKLVAIESDSEIPFRIKRVFYIYESSQDVVRGKHANEKSEFVLICVKGSCKVKTIYNNDEEEIYELDTPFKGLYIPQRVWKEMYDFSDDAVLLVLSNECYDPEEYINDMSLYKRG